MNTIELMLEALKEAYRMRVALWKNGCDCGREHTCNPLEDSLTNQLHKAIAAGEAELRREPVGFLFQHSETGRTRVVMWDDVMDASATWFRVGPLYLREVK